MKMKLIWLTLALFNSLLLSINQALKEDGEIVTEEKDSNDAEKTNGGRLIRYWHYHNADITLPFEDSENIGAKCAVKSSRVRRTLGLPKKCFSHLKKVCKFVTIGFVKQQLCAAKTHFTCVALD